MSSSPLQVDVSSGRAVTKYVLLTSLVIAAAFPYSLWSLAQGAVDESGMAPLAFGPLLALFLVAVRARPAASEPAIYDRQLNWVIGVPFLAIALVIAFLGPQRWPTLFWTWRLDLLTVPIFFAGVVTLLFGSRTLWRLRLPIALLFVVWPLPLSLVYDRISDNLTYAINQDVRFALSVFPMFKADPINASKIAVTNGTKHFTVEITDTCNGAYGLLAFLLVGGVFVATTHGKRWRKVLWIANGLGLVWIFNSARVLTILWAGQRWGEEIAMERIHPLAGTAAFGLVMVLMLIALPLFGLSSISRSKRRQGWTHRAVGANQPPPGRVAVSVVILVAASLAVANMGLVRLSTMSGVFGEARILAFEGTGLPVVPPGWSLVEFPSRNKPDQRGLAWLTKAYIDSDATWSRYLYSPTPTAGSRTEDGDSAVTVDVVTTPHSQTFDRYGIEQYGFLRYEIAESREIDLGLGITGMEHTHESQTGGQRRFSVSWVWPVRTAAGDVYERIVLVADSPSQLDGVSGGQEEALIRLERLGRELVFEQVNRSVA